MRQRRRATGLLFVSVLALPACNRGEELDAPMPTVLPDVDTLPTLPPSLLEVPITYDLSPVVADLERVVPKRFGDIEKKQPVPGNRRAHIALEAAREPFTVSLDGNTARIRAIIHYAGRAWYDPPVAPEVTASCGTGEAERPRAVVELRADLRVTPRWQLRGRSQVGEVAAFSEQKRDQCRITFLRIDMTERVTDAARKLLAGQTRNIDAKIASIDVRSKFAEFWTVLQTPIRLTDSVWLQINPIAVRQGQTSGRKKLLRAEIALAAAPRVVTGPRPEVQLTPLPPLQPAAVGEGFHVLLEGKLDYDMASDLMTKELAGKRIETGGRYIEVRSVRLFGIGGGRVALELRFGGATRGRVFFVGTPSYDAARDQLFVPDLDYDVASANVLVRGLSWLKHDAVRDFLRQRARWPVGGLVAQAKNTLVDGLNRELSPGVRLSGTVTHVEALGVRAGPKAVLVRAHADGNVRLDVRDAADAAETRPARR